MEGGWWSEREKVGGRERERVVAEDGGWGDVDGGRKEAELWD